MFGFGRKEKAPMRRNSTGTVRTVPRVPKTRVSVRMSPLDTNSFAGGENLAGNLFMSGDGNADIRIRADLARRESRRMAIENEFARGYLRRAATNIVGPQGLQLQAQARLPDGTPDKTLNDRVELEFRKWGKKKNCTLSKRYNLRQVQKLLIKSIIRDGTVLVRFVRGAGANNDFGFAIQPLEIDYLAHNYSRPLRSGSVVHQGVETSENGEVLAYHLLTGHPGDVHRGGADRVRVPAKDILCLFDPDRLHATQGLTWLIAAIRRQNMLNSFEHAAVQAAHEGAKPGGFFREIDPIDGDGNGVSPDDLPEGSFPGAFWKLPTGWDFVPYQPQHPNQNYADFRRAQLQAFAASTGLSYPGLAKDYGQINYASLRQASLDERDEWQDCQEMLAEDFFEPTFLEWLNMAALTRLSDLTSRQIEALQNPRIQKRGWPWTNPLQDVAASEKALANGLASRRSILAGQGLDFDEVLAQLADEKRAAEAAGVPLDNEVNGNGKPAGDARSNSDAGQDDDTG